MVLKNRENARGVWEHPICYYLVLDAFRAKQARDAIVSSHS